MTAVLDVVRLHLAERGVVLRALLVVPGFVVLGLLVTATGLAADDDLQPFLTYALVGGFYGTAGSALVAPAKRLLPFAVAMGRTRTAFHLGTLLVALLASLALGALLHLALVLERGTGGWGARLEVLDAAWARADDPLGQYLLFTAPFLMIFPLLLLMAELAVRWGTGGLVAGVALCGAIVLIGRAGGPAPAGPEAWPEVFLSPLPAVIGVAAAVGGWAVVRRAPV